MKKYLFILASMFCIVACEKKSPINDDKDKLPEYLDIEVTVAKGNIYKQSDVFPECPYVPEVFEHHMMTYITLEAWYGKNENDFKESLYGIKQLPQTWKYRVKREEDRVFYFRAYWDEYACRNIYYYCMVVKIQGIVVKNDSLYLNGVGYHSRLPYYKEDFEKLKNGKWTGIYH